MRVAFFSTKPYDRRFFDAANATHRHDIAYLEPRLMLETASLARGCEAVCAFVNDRLDATVLEALRAGGTRSIALRSAGYNHVDLAAAARLGFTVVHVPRYSPHAVAEHTLALILALNRHIHRAHNRVREGNFSIDGLLGFDLYGKTVGLDVYEDEAELFYEDRSNGLIVDDVFSPLLTLPNVLVTGHQAFFTREALAAIAGTTLQSLSDLAAQRPTPFALSLPTSAD